MCAPAGSKLFTEMPLILTPKGARKADPPSSEGVLGAIFSRRLFYNKNSVVFLVDPSKAQRPLSKCFLPPHRESEVQRREKGLSGELPPSYEHLAGPGKHAPRRSPRTARRGVTRKGHSADLVRGRLPTYSAPMMLSCLILPGDLPVLAP